MLDVHDWTRAGLHEDEATAVVVVDGEDVDEEDLLSRLKLDCLL